MSARSGLHLGLPPRDRNVQRRASERRRHEAAKSRRRGDKKRRERQGSLLDARALWASSHPIAAHNAARSIRLFERNMQRYMSGSIKREPKPSLIHKPTTEDIAAVTRRAK